MVQYATPADIGNRAAQHCGAEMMDAALGFAEVSKTARQISFVYDKLRRAELERNVWTYATRRTALRAIDTNTMLLTPTLWASATTYFVGSIVSDGYGTNWVSRIQGNLNNQPPSTAWEPYFGPMTVSLYSSTTTYFSGELVYTAAGDGSYRVYVSLQDGNADVPATATAWSATTTYNTSQVVTYLSVAYMSLVDLNLNQTPVSSPAAWTTSFVGGAGSLKWLEVGGAEFPFGVGLTTLNIIYPLGAGPSTQDTSRNVFRLPSGYLRQAPQDPKTGSASWLGAPTNSLYSDWAFESDYIVTSCNGVIILRFVADVQDVSKMKSMFCEGLAARIATEVCEPLTQSTAKLGAISAAYTKVMGEARTANAIEAGSEESPLDDWLAVRG